jgi:hypothetical protein
MKEVCSISDDKWSDREGRISVRRAGTADQGEKALHFK